MCVRVCLRAGVRVCERESDGGRGERQREKEKRKRECIYVQVAINVGDSRLPSVPSVKIALCSETKQV